MPDYPAMKFLLPLGAACAALLLVFGHAETAPPTSSGDQFFEKEVRPILVERCLSCHDDAMHKGGLKLT